MWRTALLIAFGASIGANLRFFGGQWIQSKASTLLPVHTLLINIIGSFALGVFFALNKKHGYDQSWTWFTAVGLLGGFTTFSAFSLETIQLLQRDEWSRAFLYVILSVICSLIATIAGMWLVGALKS